MSPRKRDSIFIQVDVKMPNHPKVFGLSDGAFRTLVTAWCYCREYTTDGFVTAAVWARYPSKARREIVAAGLAHEVDGGVMMHDFTEHQQSKAEVDAHRAKQSANGSKGGRPPKTRTQAKPTGFPLENPDGTQTKAETETELEEDKTVSSEAQAPPTRRPEVEHLCTLLADLIEANGSKRPIITQRWRDTCRLMIDRDRITPALIEGSIRWSQADEFWRGVVMSMPKLREKYDQMRLQADARRGSGLNRVPTTTTRVQAGLSLVAELEAEEAAQLAITAGGSL